jgi:hypothetical protein
MCGYMRIPVAKTVRRSPFDLLLDHAGKIKEALAVMRDGCNAYLRGDFDVLNEARKRVDELESEADRIKGNIRNHLPRSVFMPVDRGIFLMLLSEQDKVIDSIQDVLEWMDMRCKPVREEFRDDIRALIDKVMEAVEEYERVVGKLRDLIESSFSTPEREETKKYIHRLHAIESESDVLEKRLSEKIFKMEDELSPGELLHLLKLVMLLGDIADHAENCGDRIRALMAR